MVLICLGSISAQTFIGKINPVPNASQVIINSGDSLKILAVMADFLEDKDESTLGNGKFGTLLSKDYGTKILDPLPHDLNYFQKHLTFAQNYFSKVSKGKLNINFEVLSDVFTAAKTMRNYSPLSTSDDLTPLGNLSKEIWNQVKTKYPGIQFNDYDIFLIFHAGAGRDVSLPGSFGNEKDIPSVYLSDKALKQIFNDDLTGLPQNRFGKYNTMVIPETESREVSSLGGNVLVELSINGLIVSSIASHIGLPDLFDTNTGLSAIGRFGLMDGQAIFAYSGCFPPEPSAWEKIYLGWTTPVVASLKDIQINITTNLAASASDTVILKIPINASEYYLVENRIRDANKDGSKVRISSQDGGITDLLFTKDTDGYYSYNVDSLSGVILDVDEFDWALPGNGIVIWHIDENIINSKITDNKINTDKNLRGIDVEEADGIQDIGEQFTTIFGDEVVGEGDAVDFWYGTNPSKLFDNKFTKDSRPNTLSNSGANSLISLTDFSPISTKMSFKLSWGDSLIKPVFTQRLQKYAWINVAETGNEFKLFATTNDKVYVINSNGVVTDSVSINSSDYKSTALLKRNDDVILFISGFPQTSNTEKLIQALIYNTVSNTITIKEISFPYHINSIMVIRQKDDSSYEVLMGTIDGKILFYSVDALLNETNPSPLDIVQLDSYYSVYNIAASKDYFSALLRDLRESPDTVKSALYESNGQITFFDEYSEGLTLTKDNSDNYVSIANKSGELNIIMNGKILSKKRLSEYNNLFHFSVGDIKSDGNNYIVTTNADSIVVVNLLGKSADNFPYTNEILGDDLLRYSVNPIICDFYNDPLPEIIMATQNGKIFAVDGSTGKLVTGFPLTLNESVRQMNYFTASGKSYLMAKTASNKIVTWQIGTNPGKTYWAMNCADNFNSSYVPAASSTNKINSFFPTERAYNYPNPVYGDETNIRYYVSEDSKINIRIFDLAGDFVAELNDNATGGFDNETIWDVKNVQSGVYLARVEAVGASGKTENTVIKIAVIK